MTDKKNSNDYVDRLTNKVDESRKSYLRLSIIVFSLILVFLAISNGQTSEFYFLGITIKNKTFILLMLPIIFGYLMLKLIIVAYEEMICRLELNYLLKVKYNYSNSQLKYLKPTDPSMTVRIAGIHVKPKWLRILIMILAIFAPIIVPFGFQIYFCYQLFFLKDTSLQFLILSLIISVLFLILVIVIFIHFNKKLNIQKMRVFPSSDTFRDKLNLFEDEEHFI